MTGAKRIFAVLMLMALSNQALAQDVTEDDAVAIVAQIDRAIASKDIELIGAVLSDNVVIEASIAVRGRRQSHRYSKAEYLQDLSNSWAQVSEYEYQRNNQSIAVTGGRATVSADVLESMVMHGQTLTSKSREVATIERVNGVPLVTRIVASATVNAAPQRVHRGRSAAEQAQINAAMSELGCALGGGTDCSDRVVGRPAQDRGGPEVLADQETCRSKSDCGIGQDCLRPSGTFGPGRCGRPVNSSGVRDYNSLRPAPGIREVEGCRFKADCPVLFDCLKRSGELRGVCVKR